MTTLAFVTQSNRAALVRRNVLIAAGLVFRDNGTMKLPPVMRSQKEWVVPQRHFRMPAKKVVKPEQTEEERPPHQQPDTDRYQLQIDRQTKQSFKTPEAAQAMALEIKAQFPILQVSIYDSVSNSRTVVDGPKSA